jgi:hypothetical protein
VACLNLPPYVGCDQALVKVNQKTEGSREWPPGACCKRKTHIRRADEEHLSSERARQAEAGADVRDVAPQEQSLKSQEGQLHAPRTTQRTEEGAPRQAFSSLEYFHLAIYLEF